MASQHPDAALDLDEAAAGQVGESALLHAGKATIKDATICCNRSTRDLIQTGSSERSAVATPKSPEVCPPHP